MLVFVIAVMVVMLPILLGALLWAGVGRLDTVITDTKAAIEEEEKAYNKALTMGYKVRVKDDAEAQYEQVRLEAAKRAAAQPRGANVSIGHLGESNLRTASKNLSNDPITAFKIARYHGWDGARAGIPAGGVPAAGAVPAAAAVAAPAAQGKLVLVAGKDYPVQPITADMSGADKRKARIANAKAKSAAYKAAKSAGVQGAPVAAAPVAAAPAAAPVAAPVVSVAVEPPKLIEITDSMSPDEVRKARIANSKAQSAYNKALKAAGVDPNAVGETAVPAAAPPAEAAAPAPAAAPTAVGIEPPALIEITDSMSSDEVRRARIANSKAQSAYNKALKAAGIDPASLK
ncbi:MAG: hypothetical protein KDE56_16915 [Anaerolineales bacterium]|nr:hypothetical protein [Anaerolineales bacterium]